MTGCRLVLASQSPRRAELLRQAGFRFEIHPTFVDEGLLTENDPVQHVASLAFLKARAIEEQYDQAVIIGADTVVVLDGSILGKPATVDEATAMLHRLSGRTHEVYTGFALLQKPGNRAVVEHERTIVHFAELQSDEIKAYVATGEAMDKAGGYGIQGRAALFIDRIEGCYFNVVGFPLHKFYITLRDFVIRQDR